MANTVFVPNVGERMFLSNYLSNNAVTLRVVSSNWTSAPAAADSCTTGNVLLNIPSAGNTYTVTELALGPYAAQTLSSLSWTFTPAWANNVAQPATASYQATLTMSVSAGCTVYGYYVHNSGGTLLWEHQLASSVVVGTGGGNLTLCPAITAQ